MDVVVWLRDLGLEQYAEAFRANDIDADVLPALTAEDLVDLGVTSIGHRRKVLTAIAALRGEVVPAADLLTNDCSAPAADTVASPFPEGERRQVTVLFADLSGYTALSRELDAEELHQLMGEFFEAVDEVIERYGGTVDKHIGDCAMAVFGAPIARGNEPERAVRAALDIHAAMQSLGRSIRVHSGWRAAR